MPQVNVSSTLQSAGLLADYRDAYLESRRTMNSAVGRLMNLDAVTTARENTRGYFLSAPHDRYQPYGDPVVEQAMGSESFTITNYIYSKEIPYSRWDMEDDQTGSLVEAVRAGARDGGLNPERGLIDLMSNTTSFVPAVPNAGDGSAGFITSTRYGVSTGNSITVSNWEVSGPAARGAIWSAWKQIGQFQDAHGQPLHTEDVMASSIQVVGSIEDADEIFEALNLGLVAYAASTATSNAGVENVLAKKLTFEEPWLTQRISTGTMFVALTGAPQKPFVMQERSPVREWFADETNDPEARRTGRFSIGWNQRLGFGIGVPYAIVKVTNA